MSKRFTVQEDANTKHILLLIDKEDKVMWSFMATHKEAVEGVLKRLNEQDERIKRLDVDNMDLQAEVVGLEGELENLGYKLHKKNERIKELETKNRNAEHMINILEQNKLGNIGSSLQLFTENAKLKAKINELEEMVTDE